MDHSLFALNEKSGKTNSANFFFYLVAIAANPLKLPYKPNKKRVSCFQPIL